MAVIPRNWTILALICCIGLIPGRSNFARESSSPPALHLAVSGVQLYSQQALVNRKGKVGLRPGRNVFAIADLSEHLIDESVKLSAGPGIKIQEIRLETRHEKIFRHEQAREAEKFLREARSSLKRATDEYAALKEEERFLRNIKIGRVADEKQLAKKHVDPARWTETLDFVQDSLQRNHEATLAVLDRIDLAREELNVALTVAARHRSGKSVRKKEVLVTIESDTARSAPLRLEYRIRKAGWYPVYSARVNTRQTSGDLRLFAYALVRNESGEDWPNVPLAFSAADPEESAALPRLSEWRIRSVLRPVTGSTPGGRFSRRKSDASGEVASAQVMDLDEEAGPAREEAKVMPSAPALAKRRPGRNSSRGGLDKPEPQQRLDQETKDSRSFYSKNLKTVKEKRAGKRSTKIQRDLNDLKNSMRQQKRALDGGNYNEALNQSVRTLQNIRNMSPRYRGYFEEDERKAEQVRRKSLAMLETEQLVRKLVRPVISSRGYDYRYRAALRETIPSDGAFHKVLLFEKKLPVELQYESVPARKRLAFLVGRVRYSEETPLLTGPVSVFHNRDYVGQSTLNNVSSRSPFELHLGSDEDLKVSRRTSEFRGSKGLIAKDYEVRHTVRITVQNRKKFPLTLHLLDRVPYSEDEVIRITDVKFSDPPAKKNDEGLLRFTLSLRPGEKRVIELSYNLRHPRNTLPVRREQSSPRW